MNLSLVKNIFLLTAINDAIVIAQMLNSQLKVNSQEIFIQTDRRKHDFKESALLKFKVFNSNEKQTLLRYYTSIHF